MDFILNEAEVETDSLKIDLDDEDEMECDNAPLSEDEYIEEDPSFYRTFDNREEFANFENQITDPVKSSERSEKNYYGEVDLPELYAPEYRKKVEFHSFSNDKERALNFKKSLQCFIPEQENQFFYAVVYRLMYHKIKDSPISNISIDDAEKTLWREFYFELQKIKSDVMLDYTFFGFFDWCRIMNRVLAEFGFFFKFYERRNKFRYQLKQKLKSKNEMTTELSACVIQKFNGYDLLRNNLQYNEKTNLVPIDIVYEPTLDVSKPILFFRTRNLYCRPDILWKISWK